MKRNFVLFVATSSVAVLLWPGGAKATCGPGNGSTDCRARHEKQACCHEKRESCPGAGEKDCRTDGDKADRCLGNRRTNPLGEKDAGPFTAAGEPAEQAAELHDIQQIDELASVFNHAKGNPRLILLFSPTCPVCVRGARWVQTEILAKHPDPGLDVYAIWFSMYPGDARAKWKPSLLADPRVTHFWDEGRIVGRLFATQSNAPPSRPVEWDAFFVYGPEASWEKMPAPLCAFGRPVVKFRHKLRAALLPLLEATTASASEGQPRPKATAPPEFGPATERTEAIGRYEKLQYGMWINFGMMSMAGVHFTKIRTSPLPPPQTYNPTRLDVDQWIATARKAGMRYAVPDTKGWHGFCLWDSKYTDYDVAASPVKTDVVGEFVKACRKHGIAPCFSFSFVDASYERRTGGLMFDQPDDYAIKQLSELLTNYGPITTVWFDGMGGGEFPEQRIRRAYETVKSLQPDCLVVMHAPAKQYHRTLTRWPTDVLQLGQTLPPPAGHDPWMQHDGKTYYVPMEVLGWVTNLALRKGEQWSIKPLERVVEVYHGAIGRRANLAMLVWPDRQGRLPPDQVRRLLELAEAVETPQP